MQLWKTLHILAVAISLCAIFIGMPQPANAKDAYPDLNSWGAKEATCDLQPAEAAWLRGQIKNGTLRLATNEDVDKWEKMTAAMGRPLPLLDCGRTYVVLNALDIPTPTKERLLARITFIVSKNVAFPSNVKNIGAPVYDLETGGATLNRTCSVGLKRGVGHNPRECIFDDEWTVKKK